MASNENLKKIFEVCRNLQIDIGEALVMVYRTYHWIWADDYNSYWPKKGIPDNRVEEVIMFLRNNAKTRYKITAPDLHEYLLKHSPEYLRDHEYSLKQQPYYADNF